MPRSITRSIKKVPTSQNAVPEPSRNPRTSRASRLHPFIAAASDLSQAQLRECPQFEVGIACRQCNLECGICQGGRFGRVT